MCDAYGEPSTWFFIFYLKEKKNVEGYNVKPIIRLRRD